MDEKQEIPANTSSSAAIEAPREGTLAWLETLPLVDVNGRLLPNVHRVPAGSSWRSDTDRGSSCALVKPDGTACGATATRRYGVCLVHSGGGSRDVAAMGALGNAARARLRVARESLGIGPRGMANPRLVARVAAAARADDIAAALLAPLDDRKLGALEKQRAAALVLGETFPLQTATLELELPADTTAVAGMGWHELQQLAASLEPDLDQT